ncbi:MAG: hypothetical protein M0P59_15035 [Gallionella sp.]|jgi:hypothetical protein|nr:hypothetical protein [Gallionella sp.]MCK9355444.1 hypothetical protein [Gallionella sp.]
MNENKKEWGDILAKVNTKTKVLGLIALVAEGLFLGALTILREERLLFALYACAAILLVTIIGIVIIEVTETRTFKPDANRLTPSPLTPRSSFLDDVINSSIQTVCRAVSLPQTPQSAKLRVFIFRKKGSQLICSHYWSQDPVTEQVGKLRFDLTSEVAKKVAVVRAATDEKICRTSVEPIPENAQGITGDVSDELKFVLAAPIKDGEGNIWGTVDFDTSSDTGKALLSTEVSDAVMFQLAKHLSIIFALESK